MALRGVEAFTTAFQVTANRPSVPLPLSGAAQLNVTSAPQALSATGALSAGAVAGVAAFALGSRSNRRTTNVSRAAVATVGQKVTWKGNPGTVKYSGPVDFASGEWVGIELDAPNGMHDGSLFNKSYFTCTPKHGVFCQPADIGAGGAAPMAAAPAPMAAAPAMAAPAAAAGGAVSVGQKVQWKGQSGTVQYLGKVGFAPGEWVGIQLDGPNGMHDGTLFGKSYFTCPPKTGIFCTPAEIGAGGAPTPAAPSAAPMAAAPVAAPAVAAAAPAGGSFSVGSRAMWNGNAGTVQYVGEVGFATGEWVGLALDQPVGMHDGSLFNKTYFSCTAKHGVFSQASALQAA